MTNAASEAVVAAALLRDFDVDRARALFDRHRTGQLTRAEAGELLDYLAREVRVLEQAGCLHERAIAVLHHDGVEATIRLMDRGEPLP